jgi:hypothetical protein
VGLHDETARILLRRLPGSIPGNRSDAARGEAGFGSGVPGGRLSHTGRRAAQLQLRTHVLPHEGELRRGMVGRLSFRFLDDKINDRFIRLLESNGVAHSVDRRGIVHYRSENEDVVENEVLAKVRDRVFSRWQVLSCPHETVAGYREYMSHHEIPFVEELIDGEVGFLLPRKYRPHSWKIALAEARNGQAARIAASMR